MLTDEEFRLFRSLIYEESGMFLKDAKKGFLENRLSKRMQATNMTTAYWYYRFLIKNRNHELLVLLDSLTINETSFFRNLPQFELLRNEALPDLIDRNKKNPRKTLRIWSAGSSTGEEPYSIAMTILDVMPDVHDWDIRVFASDISIKSLEASHRGVYPGSKLYEAVPAVVLDRYFEPHADGYRVRDQVRRLVVFDYHNLKHENGLSALDMIFCRNVMIYFDEKEQKRLVNKFDRSLNPAGYLFLGHSESLYGWNTNFQLVFHDKGTAYRKNGGVAP